MERRFEHDFSQVRVHSDTQASAAARSLNAQAFTVGNDVVLGAGARRGDGLAARELLAHELSHVVQQRPVAQGSSAGMSSTSLLDDPALERDADRASIAAALGGRPRVRGRAARLGVQRRVTPQYADVEERLTYGILDWAITDQDAREVLQILAGLSERDLADTVVALDRDGLVERLLDNIADEDHTRFAVLIGKISQSRSTSKTVARILDRLDTGWFDWAITDQDAHDALEALMGLEPQQLRTVVAKLVNQRKFDLLMENVSEEDQKKYAAFIRHLRRLQLEFLGLVQSHLGYLRSKSEGAGATIKKTTDTTGYGGTPSTFNDLPEDTQASWRRRAAAAVAKVRKSVVGTDLEDIVKRCGFRFEPVEIERLNAYAYVSGKDTLFFGMSWIRDAEADPRYVWQSVSHELGGHEDFGETWSWEIMKASVANLTPAEKRVAFQSANSLFSAYGYLETEIYAELRELPYRVAGSSGDRPDDTTAKTGDVHDQLAELLEAVRAAGRQAHRGLSLLSGRGRSESVEGFEGTAAQGSTGSLQSLSSLRTGGSLVSTFRNTPRLQRSGLVLLDPTTGNVRRAIILQYNPDQLSRSLQVQATGESGDRSEALRIKGPPAETIKLDAELDATDQLERPDSNPAAVTAGLLPQLAALETLISPTSATLQANDALARSGTLEIAPMEAPLSLFVWSRHRIPAGARDGAQHHGGKAFDATLNPIRAKVSHGMPRAVGGRPRLLAQGRQPLHELSACQGAARATGAALRCISVPPGWGLPAMNDTIQALIDAGVLRRRRCGEQPLSRR